MLSGQKRDGEVFDHHEDEAAPPRASRAELVRNDGVCPLRHLKDTGRRVHRHLDYPLTRARKGAFRLSFSQAKQGATQLVRA